MDELRVVAWDAADPPGVVRTHSDAALWAWTPMLGPTAMLLAYRFAADVEGAISDPDAEDVAWFEVTRLAVDLGVMPSRVRSAIKRLQRFDVADLRDDAIAVRLALPPGHLPAPTMKPGTSTKATLSVDEAAEVLGISRGAAYEAARSGAIPCVRIGRRILIPTKRLYEMLESDE